MNVKGSGAEMIMEHVELDLTTMSAEEAAKALFEFIQNRGGAGFNLLSPAEDKEFTGSEDGVWRIIYESPDEWGSDLTLDERFCDHFGNECHIKILDAKRFTAETFYGWDVGFYSEK